MRRVSKIMISFSLLLSLLIAGASSPDVALGQQRSAQTQSDSANRKQLEKAMSITPRQKVDYEKPGVAVLGQCKFLEKKTKPSGFVVHHESGRVLRQFFDNNDDGKLDQWSYFKDGLEVYRDLDTNFDTSVDQCRWLGAAGTRWGIDSNQDGTIDNWKIISPEEVAYECFEAIRNLDQERFERLLLTQKEYANLQLGQSTAEDVRKRWQKAKSGFLGMARSQRVINSKAIWVYAGNGQAAMTAAGTNGNKRDLIVYDHGSGFFDANGQKDVRQLGVGSIIKVGDVWRLIELPEIVDPNKPLSSGGAFFARPDSVSGPTDPRDKLLEKMHTQLAEIEKRLQTTKGLERQKAEKDKADILVQFYKVFDRPDEKQVRQDWLENFADSVSSAYASNQFDNGLKYLDQFVKSNPNIKSLDYVKWREIFADYGWVNANGNKKERDEGHRRHIEKLKQFDKSFPTSKFTADALVQLAVDNEVRSPDEPAKAMQWYRQCKARFPNTSFGKRSAGALIRLGGLGATFPFKGQTLDKRVFNITAARGKIVILHFWETWCEPSGLEEMARIQAKYKDVVIVSCNVDEKTEDFQKFYAKNKTKMGWTQLHAPGSVDESPLAHQLGIATQPMVILVDKEGKLVETNISFGDLEREVERERRSR